MFDDDDDDDCGFFNPGLFIDENYQNFKFDFKNFTQNILALDTSSTDHDLTGQVIWPVSIFLAWFIAANRRKFENRRIVEVGAGCGISGLVASRFGQLTVLTDGSDVVLKLLAQNVALAQDCTRAVEVTQSRRLVAALRKILAQLQQKNQTLRQSLGYEPAPPSTLLSMKLMWGEKQSWQNFLQALKGHQEASGTSEKCLVPSSHIDFILGADVFCWPDLVKPLLQTVKALLIPAHLAHIKLKSTETCSSETTQPAFYCGFVCRATNTQDLVFKEAQNLGFEVRRLPNDFLPTPLPSEVHSNLELVLLRFVLRDDCDCKIEFTDSLTSQNAC